MNLQCFYFEPHTQTGVVGNPISQSFPEPDIHVFPLSSCSWPGTKGAQSHHLHIPDIPAATPWQLGTPVTLMCNRNLKRHPVAGRIFLPLLISYRSDAVEKIIWNGFGSWDGGGQRGSQWDRAGEREDSCVHRTCDAWQAAWMTHWEWLLPARSHYGRSDDGHVEVSGLLLHQVLSQGFGVRVGVGTLPNQLGSQKRDHLFVHPAGQEKSIHHWRVRGHSQLSIQRRLISILRIQIGNFLKVYKHHVLNCVERVSANTATLCFFTSQKWLLNSCILSKN